MLNRVSPPFAVSAAGASASSGTIVFSNSNGVTFGQNGSTVTASVAAAGGAQTGISSIIGSNATQTAGAVSFAASNGITFGMSTGAVSGTITASYTVPTVTNSSWTVSDNATSATVGRLAFTNSNGVTMTLSTSNNGNHTLIASHNGLTSQSTQFLAMTLGGNTAGTTTFNASNNATLFLNGGNNITLSGNGSTVTISAAAQTNQSAIKAFGVSNTGNTAGNTGVSTGIDWVLAASNSLTLSQSTAAGGPDTVWLQVGAYLTTADLSANSSKYVQNWKLTGNTAGTTSSAQGTDLWFSGGANVTVSGNSNTIVVSAAAQTNQSAIKGLGVSNTGNTAGNTGLSTGIDWVVAGTNNITASQSTTAGGPNTIWISGATAAAGSVSNYAGGNTSGTSSGTFQNVLSVIVSGAMTAAASNSGFNLSVPQTSSLSATGWVQISTNGSTISIGATTTANLYAVGNTFGTSSGTADIRTISVSGAGPISVAASNSGYVISGEVNTFYENIEWQGANSATVTLGIGTLFLVPIEPQGGLQWNNLGMIVSASVPTTSCGNTLSVSFGTSGQSQQVEFDYTFAGSNLVNLFLLSRGGGGSSSDLATLYSTQNSVVTWLYNSYKVNASAGAASQTATMSNTVSLLVSFPAMTSATSTSVNAATTVTLWGPGYFSWGSTASGSTTSSKTTGATMSISIGSTYPATTVWSSNKLLQLNWAPASVPCGAYWFGINRSTNSGSTSASATTSVAAGRSYTSAMNLTDLTMTAQLSYAGMTNSIASSLGTFGGAALASLGYDPGHGTYSATYAATKTFMNNAGQANGEIALSDVATALSFFKPWLQFNSNRI